MEYTNQTLYSILNLAIKKAVKKNILLRYTINQKDNFDCFLSYILEKGNIFYFESPKNKSTHMGTGEAIKINLNKKISPHQSLLQLKKKYEIISNIKSDKILFFGASAFDPYKKSKGIWMDIDRSKFIIPNILITINGSRTKITFTRVITKSSSLDFIYNEIEREKKLIENNKNQLTDKNTTKLFNKKVIPNKEQYCKMVNTAIDKTNNTDIEKVVLSKIEKHTLSGPLNFKTIIKHMKNKHKQCFNFILQLNDNDYFIGSTPEKLIELKKDNLLSDALAGTAKYKKNLKRDKETQEHNYVVKHIKNIFSYFCITISQTKTSIFQLDYGYHLKTQIKGKLDRPAHILSILHRLYPTPALSGYPSKKAMDTIATLEPFDRGLYGGAIGLFNIAGEGNFFVPIRSTLIRDNKIYLFAGGGITGKSNSLSEWEETEIKLQHIKSIIH